VEGGVGVAVRVTVETRDAEALDVGLAVVGLVELLLREGVSSRRNALIWTGVRMPSKIAK